MALQQGAVTITGNLGSDPVNFSRDSTRPAVSFRLGCTRRYQDRNGIWQQLPTTWITIKAFRTLALNILNSLHRGDAVIVVGVLGTEQWVGEDGNGHTRTVIEASNVGHDLNYAITTLRRVQREQKAQQQVPPVAGSGTPMPPDAQVGTDQGVPPVMRQDVPAAAAPPVELGEETLPSARMGEGTGLSQDSAGPEGHTARQYDTDDTAAQGNTRQYDALGQTGVQQGIRAEAETVVDEFAQGQEM